MAKLQSFREYTQFAIMSLEKLLTLSKLFPPGRIEPKNWPRLSDKCRRDSTYDPPTYTISSSLCEKLLSYFEPEVLFDYTPSDLEPDGVMEVGGHLSLFLF